MEQLRIDGKKQAVVMMVTYRADGGHHYVVLGRRDPRPSDVKGTWRQTPLKLGNPHFCGGEVEAQVSDALEARCGERFWNSVCETPPTLDRRVVLNGIKEMSEELNINYCDTDSMFKNARLTLFKTDQSTTRTGEPQETHYLNFDIGWLSKRQAADLARTVNPADDCIETFVKRIDTLRVNRDTGEIQLNLDRPIEKSGEAHRLKRRFTGFSDIDDYRGKCDRLINEHTSNGDHDKAAEVADERKNIDYMQERFRGLKGIDRSTLKRPVSRLQRCADNATKGNGTVLHEFLTKEWGIPDAMLEGSRWNGKSPQVQPTPVWDRGR